jgi:ABC-type sugar transport system ATPase subunit
VAENIYLGELAAQELRPVDWGTLYRPDRRDPAKSSRSGFDARTRVGDLSIANQQMVEIARALTVKPRP